MYRKKSRLLIFLVFTLALQPIFFIKSIGIVPFSDPTLLSLSRIQVLSHRFLVFCEEHSAFIHSISQKLQNSFASESGIIAPQGPAKVHKIVTKTLDVSIVDASDNLSCSRQVEIIKNIAPNSHHSVELNPVNHEVEINSQTSVMEKISSISVPVENSFDVAKYKELTKSLTEPIQFDQKTRLRINADRATAQMQAEIERELIRQKDNLSSFSVEIGAGRNRFSEFSMPVEQQMDNVAYLEFMQNSEQANTYLNYVNDFSKILLKSNSTNPIERLLAKLELSNYEIIYGPAREYMVDVVSCVMKENFDSKTGKLYNFREKAEIARDIAYFLQQIGNDKGIVSLRESVQQNLGQNSNHLIFNNGYLDSNCRKLGKLYKSFNLEKVQQSNGWWFSGYEIDGKSVERRCFSFNKDLIRECSYNKSFINDINQINEFLTKYDYHSAKKFVDNSTDFNLKFWRESLLNEVFTENGVIKEFINDPLYKSASKDELIALQMNTEIKDNCTALQRFNTVLAVRNEAKNNYQLKYVRSYISGSSIEVEKALYSLMDPIIDTNGQVDLKARFDLIIQFAKSENKELANAFAQNGILNVFNNEFANKCRQLNASKSASADFIDHANQILFYNDYYAKDPALHSKVTEAQKLFLKTFSNNTINQESFSKLKSLLSDIANPPVQLQKTDIAISKIEENQNILPKLLQESVEGEYSNAISAAETLALICAIENELNKQAGIQKNDCSKVPSNLPVPNNSGNPQNQFDPNDPKHTKIKAERLAKIKKAIERFNNCEYCKKRNIKIENVEDFTHHATHGGVRRSKPNGLHFHKKGDPHCCFDIASKKTHGNGCESSISVSYMGRSKDSTLFPESWDVDTMLDKLVDWMEANPSGITSKLDHGDILINVESPCCPRNIEILVDEVTGIPESIYPNASKLNKLTPDQLNCSSCITQII